MKDIMIKVIVVLFGVSLYFNISSFLDQQKMDDQLNRLEEQNQQLEALNEQLSENQTAADSCTKLYTISIVVINENEDFSQSVTHCTNEVLLGDVLDELQVTLSIVYDPNYSRDYIYGRMVHSFYEMGKDFEEYYAITVDGDYAPTGIDFIEIEDGREYTFTLTRWSQ